MNNRRSGVSIWLGCLVAAILSVSAPTGHAMPVTVESPDGKVKAIVSDDHGKLTYRVTMDNKAVLDPSPLGLRANGADLGEGVTINKAKRSKVSERYLFHGGKHWADNRANTAELSLTSNGMTYTADIHVADDGVAVRLNLSAVAGRKVEADGSGWKLAEADPTVWAAPFGPEYETTYAETRLSKLGSDAYGLPLTARVNGFWVTLSEAAIVDYGDSLITRQGDGTLATRLYADPDGWTTDKAVHQPWRVTIIARDLSGLVNSTLVQNLNPAPARDLAEASWIRPGVSSWQWLAIGAPLENDQRQWVDWTHELGFDYYLVDEGWANWTQPWASLANTVAYAKEKNVGIWVWIHSQEVSKPEARKALFKRFADMGVVGVKVDFPAPTNREWSNWYIDTARDAADVHLMVDFHGATKPSGTERTWPNVLTREGVRGHEWHITRYNRKLTAGHDTILPFTRYIVGPGDYTPTVFTTQELQGNTWAHELAQMIMFTSPYLSMGGHPQSYLSNPALDIIKSVPSTWDETVVLEGSAPGQVAVIARRKGRDWFISAINNDEPRDLSLKLKFIGAGNWQLQELADDADNPAAFKRNERTVTSNTALEVKLRSRGGYVAHLRKVAS